MDSPLRIGLCEDNPADTALLLKLIDQSGIAAVCESFSSGEDLLRIFAPGKYDLVFLDIYMNGIQGVEAASRIRAADRTVTLAFTTTSTEHTLESYRMKAAAYLEKPLTLEDIRDLLHLVLAKRSTTSYITLLIDGTKRNIPVESILFLSIATTR